MVDSKLHNNLLGFVKVEAIYAAGTTFLPLLASQKIY